MLALNEWGFTAVVFLLYHTVVSLMLFIMYGRQLDSLILGVSAAETVVVLGMTIASVVLFKYKPEFFGDYRKAFKSDAVSQHHYWMVVGARTILAVLMVATNSSNFAGFICLVVPTANIAYLAVRRPYNILYNNIRSIVNEAIMFVVLGIYGCY